MVLGVMREWEVVIVKHYSIVCSYDCLVLCVYRHYSIGFVFSSSSSSFLSLSSDEEQSRGSSLSWRDGGKKRRLGESEERKEGKEGRRVGGRGSQRRNEANGDSYNAWESCCVKRLSLPGVRWPRVRPSSPSGTPLLLLLLLFSNKALNKSCLSGYKIKV